MKRESPGGQKCRNVRSIGITARGRRIMFSVNAFTVLVYLTWRAFFTMPYGYGACSMAIGIVLLVVEIFGAIETVLHHMNMVEPELVSLPNVPEESFPHVDVFVSTYNEPVELLGQTLSACKQMDYPDRSKVHVYLCDDGRRQEMRSLAKEIGVGYLVRDTHAGAKAGNLNFALAHTSSPYVVTFDADMVPRREFLMRTMPYFVETEIGDHKISDGDEVKLGFVQTPQSFHDSDLFQYNLFCENRIPNEQDYFHRCIQPARTKSNSVIYCGSNTVISREALEAVGGFYEGSITEDFATGLMMEAAGYSAIATDEPLASGLSPDTLQGLVRQRTRWARGVIASGRRTGFLRADGLSVRQKLNYLASIWYWYFPVRRLVYIIGPILYAVFGLVVFRCTLREMLAFWLPMYLTGAVCQRVSGRGIRSSRWTGIYETALFLFLLFPVLMETVGITLKQFKVTRKERGHGRTGSILYAFPFAVMIAASCFGVWQCVVGMAVAKSFELCVVTFWLLSNLVNLVAGFFFALGRPCKKEPLWQTSAEGGMIHEESHSYHGSAGLDVDSL